MAPPAPDAEDLFVLYLGDRDGVERLLERLAVEPVPSANSYWAEIGATVCDPDSFQVVLGLILAAGCRR